ncbi:MAG: type II toxin-antitoxin system CcdA family antitoxin [Methanobrevibacter sp.]|nr:type II toxin-antitoxin system CcdA family antitoxin [Methanobrevibacter sp.]MBQ9024908.1 type II toxin-antitoxin system CcdA family antitoxin [Methanobrevibacter sp.]
MGKETIHVSIDENLLKIAKKNIPNLSKFFTQCLEAWLEYQDKNGDERGAELRQQFETMNMAKMKICLLLESSYYEENIEEKIENEKKTRAWLNIWKDYRRTTTYQPKAMTEATKILELTEEELEDIMWDAYEDFTHELKYQADLLDEWKYVKEHYPKWR